LISFVCFGASWMFAILLVWATAMCMFYADTLLLVDVLPVLIPHGLGRRGVLTYCYTAFC